MSRQAVRTGICAYLGGTVQTSLTGAQTWQGGPLAPYGLGTLYRSQPKLMPLGAFEVPGQVGAQSGATGVVMVERQTETRVALGGPRSGWKRRDYSVDVHLFHRSRAQHAEQAQDHLDALVDALVALIEADRTLGGACFEAGETGGISVLFGDPGTASDSPNVTETWCRTSFTAVEYVQT